MLCMIGGEAFFFFKRNMSIGDLDSSYHIANNDTGLYDFTTTNKSMHSSLGGMSTTLKGKSHKVAFTRDHEILC